jgi:putative endopeptidase
VLGAEDDALGFAVGELYVKAHFSEQAKEAAEEILADVRAALSADLATLPWMGEVTRRRAQEKLDAMTSQIGYPETWRDYGELQISSRGYAENVFRAHRFDRARRLAKIGEPTDRSEWEMPPQTVNAYYDPSLNQIVFPAGILQAPFFDEHAPAAWNYGAIGAVIGHEITHGFDDEGSRFDAEGNLVDWWTPEDATRFHERTSCISNQFSGFTVAGGVHVDGPLVTGEATADLGGVTLALRALEASGAGSGPPIAGYTPQQLFFLSYAQLWASNSRPEEERLLARVDPHPPPRYRVDGTLSNLPELRAAFGVSEGSPMAREAPCRIW